MATIDDKVVSLSFDGSKFESGIARAIAALEKLKAALHLPSAGKGLQDINAAAQKTDLSHIGNALDQIKQKFSALSVVALSVLANIANKAVAAGARMVKSLTLDPIVQGFREYETKLGSIQTILANTQAAGTKLRDVTRVLDELNRYSDETIYNFAEMAKNVGTFTAAGVDLKTAAGSIKGIANLAALSGSNSQQASTAMYQLSQAIAAGRVSLMDWNSVVNAGMGGTVFQRSLAQTAVAMGTLDEGALKLTGKMKNVTIAGESFRNSISPKTGEESWLTSEVLTSTLKQFTGDLNDAELAAMGFNEAQIKSIQQTARTAKAAATEVKTFTALLSTAKESAASGWAQTWEIIFGNFNEAKQLWTGISNVFTGFINKSAETRNKVLADWKALGGRTDLLEGLKNIFEGIVSVLKPVRDAFRQIFPPTTGAQLADLSRKFRELTENFKIGPETANNLKRTFAGLFAILSIGRQIVGGVIRVFAKLIGAVSGGGAGFLAFTGGIGDFLVAIDQALKKGNALNNFFDALGDILAVPIHMLMQLSNAIFGIFTGFDSKGSGGFSASFDAMSESLEPMAQLIGGVTDAFSGFMDMLQDIGTALAPLLGDIGGALTEFGEILANMFEGVSLDTFLTGLEVGLVGGIAVMIRKFIKSFTEGSGLGIFDSIKGSFEALTGSLTAMQNNIKANTLLQIAAAVALLTASVVALSLIDSKKLNSALTAMAVGFGQLLGAMAILTNITKSAAFLKVPFIAAALILLATAVGILTMAVTNLSQLSWGELIKGLAGVGTLLGIIVVAAGPLGKVSGGLVRAGVGILAIGIAMKILASAIKDFGGLSWGELGKGIGAVAAGLVVIGYAARLFPVGMVGIGAGLVAVALGLKILASAVGSFGELSWGEIGKGIISIAVAMGIIASAMTLMPPNMFATAAGLLLVALALKGIGSVISSLGGMSIEKIAKGIGSLAAALLVLGVAMYAFSGSLAGAAALAVAAASLALLAPAMIALGKQSWEQIVKGLVGLAGVMVILGVAGALMTPVVPTLLGLGAALLLIGAGLALAGAGIALVGTGLSAIALSGSAALGILINGLMRIVETIPQMAVKFVQGLLSIVEQIAAVAPKFMAAFVKIIITLVDAVIQVAPKLEKAMGALIQMMLRVIVSNFPSILSAGFKLLLAFLDGISNNMGQVVTKVVEVIRTFLVTVAGQMGNIVTMGAQVLVAFLRGIANSIGRVISQAAHVMGAFLDGIANSIGKVINSGVHVLVSFVNGIGSNVGKLISAGARMVVNLIDGIGDKIGSVVHAAANLISKFMHAIASAGGQLAQEGGEAAVKLIRGIRQGIENNSGQLNSEMRQLGSAMTSALAGALLAGASGVVSAAAGVAGRALSAIKSKLKIRSPSRVFMEIGENIIQGLTIGLESESSNLNNQAVKSVDGMVDSLAGQLKAVPDLLAGMMDVNPVITPILDLTQARAEAALLDSMLNVTPITAAASYGQAAAISADRNSVQTSMDDNVVAPGGTQIKFEQNNYSPEALSAAEIYRQTKNQLSIAKTALNIA